MNRIDGPEGGAGHDLLVGQEGSADRNRSGVLHANGKSHTILTRERWVIPTGAATSSRRH